MKIGIMTWFSYCNYGTVFQAVSLYTVLKNKGYNPVMINYLPRKKINYNQLSRKIILRKVKSKIRTMNPNVDSFKDFLRKNVSFTEKCDSFSELNNLNNDISVFVCGSDQIWSPLCFDDKYFLNFASRNKILAYAPSIGTNQLSDDLIRDKMKKLIMRFKYLSVREKTGKDIIKDICGVNAEVVLDPTLLLCGKEWLSLAGSNVSTEKGKYILCYFLGDSNKYFKKVKQIAKVLNLSIINVPTHKYERINKYNYPYNVTPEKFLHLINDSALVLTDSYHGMLFSINFNKTFYCFKRFNDSDIQSQNSRIIDMLDTLNLRERIIDYNDKVFEYSKIDYKKTNDIVKVLREKSMHFLFDSIDSIQTNDLNVCNTIECENCSGCGSCAAICKKGAIKIGENEQGFFSYTIDESKCIKCGLCKKVCPMLNIDSTIIDDNTELLAYKSNSNKTLKNSSSGGISNDLAVYYNNSGYYICGVSYSYDEMLAKHVIIDPNDEKELHQIQGSKYLQSESYHALKEVCNLSIDNKIVFLGTPCQVSGLHHLLKFTGDRGNVILVEIICHGVPSYKLWKKYLCEVHSKIKSKENKIIFRDKDKSWHEKNIFIQSSIGKYSKSEKKDCFYAFFNSGVVNNTSCYECPYRLKSNADLRIGDYWGSKYSKDKTGVSMVIPMTENGKKVINNIKKANFGVFKKQSIEDYFKYQQVKNINSPIFREELIKKFDDSNVKLHILEKQYLCYIDFYNRIKRIIKLVKRK